MTDGYPSYGDHILATAYVLCFVLGVPSNILTVRYFRTKRKDIATSLFLWTAVMDMISLPCITIPTVVSLVSEREAMIYSNKYCCAVLGMILKIQGMTSLFILTVLSFSRTFALLFPLKIQNRNATLLAVAVYSFLILLGQTVPVAAAKLSFKYHHHDVYCWDTSDNPTWDNIDNFTDIGIYSIPIIPVIISMMVSCYKIFLTSRKTQISSKTLQIKRNATITVILYTCSYLILNIPNYLNYITWVTFDGNPEFRYTNSFIKFYGFNITDCLCVALTSTINPIILYLRVKRYKITFSQKPPLDIQRDTPATRAFYSHYGGTVYRNKLTFDTARDAFKNLRKTKINTISSDD